MERHRDVRNSLPAFFINLDRDLDRRALLEKELEQADISAERIAAVDGRAVPDFLKPFYDGRMSAGEVGCSASHLLICKTIIDRDLPFALVLEDDARFAEDIRSTIMSAVRMAPQDWDIIRLIESSPCPVQTLADLGGRRHLVRFLKIPRSTTGLIVSASGAKKLLTRRLIKEPIDVEIRWPWQLDLNVYGIDPPLMVQASEIDLASTIPVRSRPKKFNQLRRMVFNIRKMGFAQYLICQIGRRRTSELATQAVRLRNGGRAVRAIAPVVAGIFS